METRFILELIPEEGFDYINDFVMNLSDRKPVDLSKCKVVQHNSILDFKSEIIDYIIRYGFTAFISSKLITEEIIPPGESQNQIVALLHKYLTEIEVSTELIIVDPYFYARNRDPDYITLIVSTLSPFLPTLETIHIITLPNNNVDSILKSRLDNSMLAINNSLQIKHNTSTEFHDRFWLNRQKNKGFITGTSLNGLGRKYALIDSLKEDDFKDILVAVTPLL